jgi:hypothetical protein
MKIHPSHRQNTPPARRQARAATKHTLAENIVYPTLTTVITGHKIKARKAADRDPARIPTNVPVSTG